MKCFEDNFEPRPNELAGGRGVGHSRIMHYVFTHCIWPVLRYVYTLWIVGSISYLGGCYRRTKVTKCLCQKMTLFSAVLISVCEPLNYIHQDTKSARVIAVCTRSITLNKFGKRARGCCLYVFLVYNLPFSFQYGKWTYLAIELKRDEDDNGVIDLGAKSKKFVDRWFEWVVLWRFSMILLDIFGGCNWNL